MTWQPCPIGGHDTDERGECRICGMYKLPDTVPDGAVISKRRELGDITRNLDADPETPLGYAPITQRGVL